MNNTNSRSRRNFNRPGSAPQNGNRRYGPRPASNTSAQAKSNKTKSNLDPRRLIKSAVPLDEAVYVSKRTFDDMPINNKLKAAINKKGYTHPTEIQDKTLEQLIKGVDLMGIAQTGTGKTGAFLIPLIHRLMEGSRFQTLVMVPTRELACQVEDEFKSMAHGLSLNSACFIGGTNLDRDMQKLKRHAHIVIGTPGRLLDLYNRRALHLDQFSVLILDEFDRMLDMGFAPDVQRIIKAMTGRRQTMLFSATVDMTQQHLIDQLLRDPIVVKVSTGATTGDHIAQDIIKVRDGDEKFEILLEMVRQDDFEKVLVFAETKGWVKRLHKKLVSAGIKVDLIHGDKTQNNRQRALDEFKQGRIQVLVATDVAARGLDVSDVTHVINYQLPRTYDSYIHRIGRTGRAGKGGKAYTFVE